jgi:hypothetical protein
VGILSDGLRAGFGAESLRYAMACISVMYTVAAVCYLRAARTLNVSQALREAPAA